MDENVVNEDMGEVAYVLDEDAEEIIDVGPGNDGVDNDDDSIGDDGNEGNSGTGV